VAKRTPDDVVHLAGQLSQMAGQLWRWHFGEFPGGDSWSPAVNLYHLPRRVEVCVDVAGVDRRHLDVRVEPGRLIIRGVRQPPEPPHEPEQPMRIISMEIDHGPFCRVVALPDRVDLAAVESEYVNGLLWIRLPLRDPG
jgi:HSP20 family protein